MNPSEPQPTAERQTEVLAPPVTGEEPRPTSDVPPPLPPDAATPAAGALPTGSGRSGRRDDQRVPALPALPPQPVPEVPPAPQPHDLSRIAQDLQIRKAQVEAVVSLLDDENTVPFITRYRKERTGGLNEDVIRRVQARVAGLRALAERKRTVLRSIAFQAKLTDALT